MKQYGLTASFYAEARRTYTSLSVAIGIPAGVSFIAGVLSGILAGAIAWYIDAKYPLRIAAIVGSVAGLLALGNAIFWWREMVLGVESTMTAMNNPAISINPIRIEQVENQGRLSKYIKLPGAQAQHLAVAKHVMSGGRMNLKSLYSFFTQADAQAYMNALIKYEYVAWRSLDEPRSGVRITEKGLEMFEQTIKHFDITPLPHADVLLSGNPFLEIHNTYTEDDDYE